ncbi:futalosine hydrolase [Streptomyces sp. NBC_00083]|uniref:futalosine hydrolase n=1 Tax=Streptomyces sp. NBC_00083 TaxID=2975647 RepID=UPI00224C88D0|nr:futalosine hydrolase [Streptomyces sp. NBC_00083]MCX5387915.1 futalosine hydrolase [Streptomyces sp. NBC_00083]
MRVLVATAVAAEADSVAAGLAAAGYARLGEEFVRRAVHTAPGSVPSPLIRYGRAGHEIHVYPAGVGPAAAAAGTALALGRGPGYDLVVSAGIGGGFPGAAPLGSLVVSSRIVAADLGAGSPEGFIPVAELGFGRHEVPVPGALGRRATEALGAALGTILTVTTATGTAERAAALLAGHPRAVAEAMEGFGVAEAADQYGLPVLEIRAISNEVGPRDRSAWRIGDALAALTGAFGKLPPVLESWTTHEH